MSSAVGSATFQWVTCDGVAGECPEWQRELTVNQPPHGFVGSSPTSPTILKNRDNFWKLLAVTGSQVVRWVTIGSRMRGDLCAIASVALLGVARSQRLQNLPLLSEDCRAAWATPDRFNTVITLWLHPPASPTLTTFLATFGCVMATRRILAGVDRKNVAKLC